jgi:hypothetical protein
MNLPNVFKSDDYLSKQLTEYVITPEVAKTFTESIFLNIFKEDCFFMVFQFPIGEIDTFLDRLGFKRSQRMSYTHVCGFSFDLSVYQKARHNGGYYLSVLNHPNYKKRISFDFEYACSIDVSYVHDDERYSSGDYNLRFGYSVTIDEASYRIRSIYHTSNFFDLDHVEINTSDTLRLATFAQTLDYSIHRIEEDRLEFVVINDKKFENISMFNVRYALTFDDNRIRSFSLADIIQVCGFSHELMMSDSIDKFLNIENLFNEDELKVIEMTFI